MTPDSLLAPLTPAEREQVAARLYRGCSRLLDAGEDHLYAMTSYPSWTESYKRHETQAHALMAASRELRELHAEITARTETTAGH